MAWMSLKPNAVNEALENVRKGGRLMVATYARVTIVDSKVLAKFEKAGAWLLKADGDGYRLRSGKGSVYLFPGQLQIEASK
jgi:hypothetical protein